MNSSAVLNRLQTLRKIHWIQDFTFTPEQNAEYNQLRRLRWNRVAEMQRAE